MHELAREPVTMPTSEEEAAEMAKAEAEYLAFSTDWQARQRGELTDDDPGPARWDWIGYRTALAERGEEPPLLDD